MQLKAQLRINSAIALLCCSSFRSVSLAVFEDCDTPGIPHCSFFPTK